MKLIADDKTLKTIQEIQGIMNSAARRVHFAVGDMRVGYSLLWNRPNHEVEMILNAMGPEKVGILFEANSLHGKALNDLLDFYADDNLGSRVVLVPGKVVSINPETGKFVVSDPEPGQAEAREGAEPPPLGETEPELGTEPMDPEPTPEEKPPELAD